jgi:lysophospholipase L1-like esterase
MPGGSITPATTLPNGIVVPITHTYIGGPLRNELTASLPGNPTVDGYSCLAVNRPYTCNGTPRTVSSPTVLRLKTDAPVVELSGVATDGSSTVQTLIVNGTLVPPTCLSASLGVGGWLGGTIRLDFGTRLVRDIWIETAMYIAYIKIDQHDTLLPVEDSSEPQITVVGDSYQAVRSNAFGNGAAIALELGARLGIRKVATDGLGGTGYWNQNSVGNLNDRLVAHAADLSTIYLVMAGLNDYGNLTSSDTVAWPTTAQYENAVTGYLQGLRAAEPNALIVVTAPFSPDPPQSDSSYVAWSATNTSGMGDFLWKTQLQKSAVQQIAAPWIYIDVLMGTGWLNSSGASGPGAASDVPGLQWFTGGTPAPGTTATYKPGNTLGGGGGGFGGIQSVPLLVPGQYSQAPNLVAFGGTGTGLLLASVIDSAGALTSVAVVAPGTGYTAGEGLPQISIDPTYEMSPAVLGEPTLITGVNPDGEYPLPSFAPPGSSGDLNNIYVYLSVDTVHPSPLGVNYLSTRLAQHIYAAVMAL